MDNAQSAEKIQAKAALGRKSVREIGKTLLHALDPETTSDALWAALVEEFEARKLQVDAWPLSDGEGMDNLEGAIAKLHGLPNGRRQAAQARFAQSFGSKSWIGARVDWENEQKRMYPGLRQPGVLGRVAQTALLNKERWSDPQEPPMHLAGLLGMAIEAALTGPSDALQRRGIAIEGLVRASRDAGIGHRAIDDELHARLAQRNQAGLNEALREIQALREQEALAAIAGAAEGAPATRALRI